MGTSRCRQKHYFDKLTPLGQPTGFTHPHLMKEDESKQLVFNLVNSNTRKKILALCSMYILNNRKLVHYIYSFLFMLCYIVTAGISRDEYTERRTNLIK